uniref:Protein wntless n=1 Tax=Timema shepardi TaxID=629360 RepID=A0A7R9AYT9_TIMSH|nr:unnamed protein product [Timema shepardi]
MRVSAVLNGYQWLRRPLLPPTARCYASVNCAMKVWRLASEGRWKWDDEMKLEFTSAFFTGVYGMWNIYIFALIVLYAPSHKQWPTETENHGIVNEEIEFSRLATDPSSLLNALCHKSSSFRGRKELLFLFYLSSENDKGRFGIEEKKV